MRLAQILFIITLSLTKLNAQVTANFTADDYEGCSPLSVSFTDMSLGAVSSWAWTFGNGNTSSLPNPGAVYITPGTYPVCLTVSDGVNSDTFCDTIILHPNPTVNFIADDTLGCANLNVNFTNLSITGQGIAAALWNFGDGSTSNLVNPSHTFTPGLYDITLIVTDSSGCISQGDKLDYIESISAPNVQFNASNPQACFVPHTVNFSNTTTNAGGASYFWDFGDGNTSTLSNPAHTYTAFGSYTVTLIVNKGGCIDSLVRTNYVVLQGQNTNFNANFTTRCVGQPIQFNDISTLVPNAWSWNFGDGTALGTTQNPSHTYTTAGTYTVTLNTTLPGCNDVETKLNYITIHANPTVSFVSDKTDTCGAPFTVNFNATTSPVTTYLWNFGDASTSNLANPSHTYTTPGNFTVSLTVTNANGCSATSAQIALIQITPPFANFSIDSIEGCIPKTIQITDLSTSANTVSNWIWDFGDGNTQIGINNPTHTYIDTGTFVVNLIVEDANGCTDTLNPGQIVEVGQPLIVDFSATPLIACKIDPINFTNLTDTLGITGVQWIWDFGDGGIENAFEPIYEYGDTGVFEVSLTAIHKGCFSSISYPDLITINPPIALFSTITNCSNYNHVSFIDESIEPESWIWDINGDTFTTQNADYIFPGEGTYSIVLYVENFTYGCIDSTSLDITIAYPTRGFIVNDSIGCRPFATSFTDTSTLISSWLWDFGLGNTSTNQNPNKTYNVTGVYTVSQYTTDIYGCVDTITYPNAITVIGINTYFEADDTVGCRPMPVQFTDMSSSISGTITNWSWTFGDGNTSNLQNPAHVYNNVGNYAVSLTTTDSEGCTQTYNRPNYVSATGPIPSFTHPNLTCINNSITITNNSTTQGSTIVNYLWDFGDGSTSNVASPSHTYTNAGLYTLTLYMQDGNGCDTTFIKPNAITVDSLIVDFAADSTVGGCTGFIVNFSQLVSPNPNSWSWDFGNGITSNIQNPSTVFSTVGSFDVTLIATNTAGCRDTIVKPNFITVNGPIGVLTTSIDTGCIPLGVNFNVLSPNSINQIWDFGDGTVLANTNFNFNHIYTDVNTFIPLVVLEDSAGCLVPYYFDTIYTGEVNAILDADLQYICTPNVVQFFDSSFANPPADFWLWNFGDGNSSNLQNPSHNYISDGIFDIQLITGNAFCADTINVAQYIVSDSSTLANFSFLPPALLCPPVSVLFTNLSSADSVIVNYTWDFGNGDVSNLSNPGSIIFDTAGTYFIRLDILTDKGCTSSFSDSITINAIPTFSFDLDSMILCLNEDTIFSSLQDQASITWTPATNLSCADCPDPTIFGVESTTYFVNAVNTFGCTYSDTLYLTVSQLPALTVSEDQIVLINTEVTMNAFSPGVSNYNWTPNENLSCANCTTPSFTANETTTFVVSISDDLGCVNSDSITIEVFNMCDDGFLLFPNVFTPNNDAKNDIFKPTSLRNLETPIAYFRIFDRWGKLLFETDDINKGWDGTKNGTPMNNGVYVYTVSVQCTDGNQQIFSGNVTLIR